MGVDVLPSRSAESDGPVFITDKLEKPDVDDRSYRVIRLTNQLEVLIAHDPKTDKASAAIDVNVGAFSDESDMPGMAHAVEHLLFMGTEKYPAENHYHQFLSSNSGSSNAYTASTSTNYFFDVAAKPSNDEEPTEENPSPFHEALDIFAQFFIAPLFLVETLDRELKAVDSENKKNLQSDIWRLHQLEKSLSNPNHPYCHFSTGNFEVLKTIPESRGVNVRDKFMEFHDKYYSANLMKLVVLGREPLDLLQKWVVEIFSAIPNKNLKPNRWIEETPLRKSELGKVIYAKPVYDKKELCLTFPVMDEHLLWNSRPSGYVSHLIGHEGPGSLMSYLKGKGWVNTLSVGASAICPGSHGLLECDMRLTEAGIKNYKEVTKAFFQYVSLLRETKPQRWIFEEQQLLADVTFKFRQKTTESRFTSRTSSTMQRPYPRECILSGPFKGREFRPDLVEEIIDSLNPDNFRMLVTSKTFPGNWNKREKWYNTEYRLEDLDAAFIESLQEALASTDETRLKELFLPSKNRFVPTNLDVNMKKAKDPQVAPKLIRNDAKARTWWKKDDTFGVPKASVITHVRQPLVYATCQTAAQARLYAELVRDALEEHSYDAELAGLSYSISVDNRGYSIDVSGYNDKLGVLLKEVLLKVRNVEISESRFEIIRERVTRNLRNWKLQSAYNQISFVTQCLIAEKEYSVPGLLEYLAQATVDDVRFFHKLLLSQGHYEVLVHGNLGKEDALNMTTLVETTLGSQILPPSEWPAIRHMVLPQGSNFVFNETLEDSENINNCIEYWFYVGTSDDIRTRAILLLFDQMTNEPSFDQLRTKEQLGYVVFSGCRAWQNMLSYRVLVQSEKYPQYLHSRIQAFLAAQRGAIEDMTDVEFESHKRSLIVSRTKKPDNLTNETANFTAQITNGYYRFDIGTLDAEAAKDLVKTDVLAFYDKIIADSSPTRTKLVVQLFARGETKIEELVVKGISHIENYSSEAKSAVRAIIVEAILRKSASDVARALKDYVGLTRETVEAILKDIGSDIEAVGNERAQNKDKKMEFDLPECTYGPGVQYITDVAEWKRGLPVSAVSKPVKDLGEFEELGPKL